MRDEAHVRLVDAHAEGDGGHDDDAVLALEPRLHLAAHRRVEAGVVGERRHAMAREELGGLLDLGAGRAIDDAGVAGVVRLDEGQQLAARIVLLDQPVADVGPVEAGHEAARLLERQALDDLLAGRAHRRSPSARCAAPAESARPAPTGRCTRDGNRGPTAKRNAPRRWRSARPACARASPGSVRSAGAPARRRAGPACPRAPTAPPPPLRRRSATS